MNKVIKNEEQFANWFKSNYNEFMDDFYKKNKNKITFMFFFIEIFMMISFANAATIFSDGFESGTLNGWNLTAASGANNWTNTVTGPQEGTRHAQSQPQSTSEPASVIEKNISTEGYENITIRYYRKLIALDIADEFQMEWNDGTGWIILEQTGGSSADDAGYIFKEFNLSTNADNNANFRIKFECTAGAVSEFCRVDNVSISGDAILSTDTTKPLVNLISPINSTAITTNVSYFTASFTDNINVSNATLYVWNSTSLVGTNFTKLGNASISSNLSFTLPRTGTYFWNYLAYDNSSNSAFNNTNFTLVFSLPDTTSPLFSNFIEIPLNGSSYVSGQTYRFNVTVSESSIGTVGIEFNGINYTTQITNISNVYMFNRTNFVTGTYNYYWWANDTNGNYNATGIRYYTIEKANPDVRLYLNGARSGANATFGVQTNASFYSNVTGVILYKDGVDVTTSENGLNITRGAGYYNFTAYFAGNQNHSSGTETFFLNISKSNGSISLLLNGNANNLTIQYPQQSNISASTLYGSLTIYQDGSVITSENGLNATRGFGYYNITAVSSGDQNHSSTSVNYWLNVTKANGAVYTFLNNLRANITIIQGSSILLNGTLINGTGNIQLYNNGTLINSGNNLSNFTVFSDVEIYNITTIYLGNENYTANSETWFVNVSSSGINLVPIINSNNTIVNGSVKVPVDGDNFFIKVNVTDPENFTDFVNFSLIAPNGSEAINNKKGINYSSGGNLIWESDNYTINDYGYWNWSYILSDGSNFIRVNGTFRVLSEIRIFPSIYEFTPDPKNQTLIWNLSLYHLSNEDYNFSFTHMLNTTYFNLTFTNKSVVLSKKVYNDSNLFNNQIRIDIFQNVQEDIIYRGNITIMRILDGKNYTIPLIIGINPPSGNIDAFNLNNVRCSGGNCDINTNMENDGSKTFSWVLRNTGNHSLMGCMLNITGFDISNFGGFSNNNFNLNIGESLALSLTINNPSINTYYGQLETTCKATSSGFNTSLSSESDNAPRIRLLVTADSGNAVSPPSGGNEGGLGGGGSRSIGILKPKNITKIVKINLSFLEEIILKKGTSGNAKLQVINIGNIFLNNCKLRFSGDVASWLSNDQTKGLGEGEKFVYDINVNVPDKGEHGEFLSNVEMVCDEGSSDIKIKVNVYRNSFEGEIGEYERNGGNLKVYYNLNEYSGEDHDISVIYEMKDLDNITRYRGQAATKLLNREKKKENIEFKLPKNSFGEFVFVMEFNDGVALINKEKKIFLPSSTSNIGFVISTNARKRLSIVGVFLISLVVLFFVVRFIYKYHRKSKAVYGHGLRFRKLIKLEI